MTEYNVYFPQSPSVRIRTPRLNAAGKCGWQLNEFKFGNNAQMFKAADLSIEPIGTLPLRCAKWLSEVLRKPDQYEIPAYLPLNEVFPQGPRPVRDKMIDIVVLDDDVTIDISPKGTVRYLLKNKDRSLSGWHSFWTTYWNNPSELRPYQVISGVSLRSMPRTKGKLLVRQDDIATYSRLLEARLLEMPGVLITGQPGNGKTYQLHVLLALRLMEGEITFFCMGQVVYRFDQSGVKPINATVENLPESEDGSSRAWVFIDWDDSNSEPPAILTKSRLFVVQASSPKKSRFAQWTKTGVPVLITKKWTLDELVAAAPLQVEYTVSPINESDIGSKVSDAMSKWGSAPRDVYSAAFRSHASNEKRLQIAVENLTIQHLTAFLNMAAANDGSPDIASYTLISVYLLEPSPIKYATQDRVLIDFKSWYIHTQVSRRLEVLQYQDAKELFGKCRNFPECAVLAGWVFESLAIETIRKAASIVSLPVLRMMTSKKDKRCWTFSPDTSSREMSPILRFLSHGLELCKFDKSFEAVGQDGLFKKIYVPFRRNNPLFDAFVLSKDGDDRVVVHVLQMTIAAVHKGSAKGYTLLKTLRQRLINMRKPGGGRGDLPSSAKHAKLLPFKVDFRYYIVAPDTRQSRALEWQLPRKLPSVLEGSFFVQHILVEDHILSPYSVIDECEEGYLAEEWRDVQDTDVDDDEV